jgi:hypothetical protein
MVISEEYTPPWDRPEFDGDHTYQTIDMEVSIPFFKSLGSYGYERRYDDVYSVWPECRTILVWWAYVGVG